MGGRLGWMVEMVVRGRKQVSKRSTHARPGMHMQQCPAVPHDHRYDTRVLPYNCLHLMALFCQHGCVYMLQDRKRRRQPRRERGEKGVQATV